MPLRDHFHAPFAEENSWGGFHAQWPAVMVIDLNQRLPAHFRAEPRVQLGAVTIATEFPQQDEYEVRIYQTPAMRLVAAVEIVSEANKDRPKHRRAFAAKCATLLRQGAAPSRIDL